MAENSKIEWTDRVNPLTGKPGPAPKRALDGDRKQARHRVNVEVRTGYRPHPNTLPCVDCGHVWSEGERRHEYDHYKGYAAENHLTVEPVCTLCHAQRDSLKVRQTHCIHGHEFTPENTIIKTSGTRQCRECRRASDRHRARGASYWREYRASRRVGNGI